MALRTGKHRAGTPPRQTLQHARWTGARWDTAILLCTVTPWERETLRGTHCMLRGRQGRHLVQPCRFRGRRLSSDFGLSSSVCRSAMGLTERLATAITINGINPTLIIRSRPVGPAYLSNRLDAVGAYVAAYALHQRCAPRRCHTPPGAGAALDDHADPLKDRDPGQTLQRLHPPASAYGILPSALAPPPSHPLRRPQTPRAPPRICHGQEPTAGYPIPY